MDQSILAEAIQDFISSHIETDVNQLALQKNKFPNSDYTAILNQIAAKQKAKTKLPTWFSAENIIYPSKISVEQTSSERTAEYKSQWVSGKSLMDLSGGFGVDDYYFAKKLNQVIHCEINQELSTIVHHNFEQLKASNIQCFSGDSYDILKIQNPKLDWIYIDPSRRNEAKGKVFMLKDCLPNVPENLDFYFDFAPNIMIKTAPLLDITAGLSELKNVKAIHIVALENEVKELLWILEKNYEGSTQIVTANLLKTKTEEFRFELNADHQASFGLPQKYLYEPNAAIMKSGGFDVVSCRFELNKLHQHSHLYTSDTLIDFPGRRFEIQHYIGYNKNEMKPLLENQKANLTTRNFPDSVDSIRKKWKIKDGGNLYCFFTTDANNNKIVLLCSKLP
ncbi:class I SAM-dependent methyltransferase [Flavobacterium sp. J49]|uniref:THUMP-like domain-containing protein n=1 Tax=Flavobacterium sp. J49 TaxID=2718534 RepID=UPI001592C2F3|nr:class I SAM-dependent methyltransferase [Flavobacterium sp. J49]MBF6642389.1 class I SAM-dependent methyltransferase [Flavobacterium sp. J49]NIC03635.1 class I SAM-dependent methyltransferase [Flavobacterium sp. J49]